jgi:F-type H+-transporting ATPase subunit a
MHARILEKALLANALTLVAPFASADEEFHGPSLTDFFPPGFLFEDTPFEVNRLIFVRLIAVAALLLLFWLGTRRMRVVPGRGQSLIELGAGFVRKNIAIDTLGEKEGMRFLPLLTAMFWFIIFLNITGIIPGLNIAGSSVVGLPLVLAVTSYVVFIYAGLRKHPVGFIKNSLFPPGVPWPVYLVVTPMEFISTFIVRPVTLALRLLMNMVAGHMLLVLCFSATHFFIFTAGSWWGLFSIGTFAFGLAFSIFEILVAALQAYVFTLLTAVYIQLALAEEH